ncbi:solute carrier family 22 member 15 precursor [Penaeus vannamei]|uniref:Solute carrier family 22 member 15 n=1 Tax=Penaeus vannamei TaxID=6689 RepID=A0A3R7STV3_PENVA|nr:solute carrier family 22 member 15 precursor [Penaeus vannamei]
MDESPRWLAVGAAPARPPSAAEGRQVERGRPAPRGRASAPAQGRSQGRGNGTPAPRRPRPHRERLVQKATPRLRTITLSLYTNYLLVGAVYFGLSLSGGDLSSDPFLYMVLTGVVELPAYTLVIPLVARYGRRAPVVAFFFMGAVALLALPFVPTGSGESMTLALMGKMSIASAFQILDFYSSELFPTEVRTRGMSTALVMSRGPLYPWAPSAVFGAASVLAGLATLALPETLHVPLPDTIAHLEEREIRTSGFLRLPVRDPSTPDSTPPRGFHSKGIPLGGFHSRGFHSHSGDSTPSTPRGFHS